MGTLRGKFGAVAAVAALVVGVYAAPASAHHNEDFAARPGGFCAIDPATWDGENHPAKDYYAVNGCTSVADRYQVDELFGCHVDHPYMRWLLDETREEVETKFQTMRDALIGGFVPMSPAPNDFGYPDTYWHWWNQLNARPDWQDRPLGAEPQQDREWIVQPHEIQHLLLVPAVWKGAVTEAWGKVVGPIDSDYEDNSNPQGEQTDGWVTGGVMYATEIDPGPELYHGNDAADPSATCNPFHGHNDVDTEHFHMWLYHHVSPLAMNPPHLCNADGTQKQAPYGPLDVTRNTDTDWHCYYPEAAEHPDGHAHQH